MTETGPQVIIQPVVSWPRQVEPGGSYLVTVDLRLPEVAEEWPYDEEEFVVGCMLDGRAACRVRAMGAAGVVLHRFGGTYGAACFIADVSESPHDLADAALWLTLTTEGGLPFYTGKLPLDGTPVPEVPDVPLGKRTKSINRPRRRPRKRQPIAVSAGRLDVSQYGVPAEAPAVAGPVASDKPEPWPFHPARLPGGALWEKPTDPWTSWEPCEGGESEEALRRLARDVPKFFANATRVVGRWSPLPFYATHRLMEFQFTRGFGVERAFALHGPERTWWLNGASDPMHDVNEAESLALSRSEVADYIRFFLYFLRAENGAFVLIESADEVSPRADIDGGDDDQGEILTLEAARSWARPLVARGPDATGQWLANATVAYDGALADASLAVSAGGEVEMTDDHPIGALDALTVPEAPSLELHPRFDSRAVEEYLRGRLGAGYPAGLDITAVTRLTHGVPLAVALVAELLGGGIDPTAALAPIRAVDEPGMLLELVRGYLVYTGSIPSLQPDRPLLYGLALLDSEADRPGLPEGLPDPEALAALWDAPVQTVPARLDDLAERHDFLLGNDRRLHPELREHVLRFLLDPLERPAVRAMNARAAALYRQRADSAGHPTIDAQIADQDWQSAVTALLWHTFWADLDQGLQMLRGLFAAAVALDDSFAAALLRVAAAFAPACTPDARRLISDLQVVSGLQSGSRPAQARAEASARDMIRALRSYPAAPLLAATPPAATYHDLLQAGCDEALGLAVSSRAALLLRAASDVQPGGATARALSSRARRLDVDPAEYRNATADAQQAITSALALITRFNPADADAYNDLGNALFNLSLVTEAGAAYQEALRLDPSGSVYHSNLGNALTGRGRFAEAEAACREALRLDPSSGHAYQALVYALTGQGRWADAESACREALRLDPSADAYSSLGYALVGQGRFAEAEAAYREALGLEPSSADAYSSLGYALAGLGRFAEAEAAYREALRLDPSFVNSLSSLGFLYLIILGRVDEAETALREGLRLDPEWVSMHSNLGSLYVVTGDLAAARSSFLQATQSAPAKHAFSEVMLGVLDRGTDPSAAEGHFTAALTALDEPVQPTTLTPFGRAEIQALAMVGLDRGDEAAAVLEPAVSERSGLDVFRRRHYDLFTAAGLTPGIDALVAIWRDIVASDSSAAGPWGAPGTLE